MIHHHSQTKHNVMWLFKELGGHNSEKAYHTDEIGTTNHHIYMFQENKLGASQQIS